MTRAERRRRAQTVLQKRHHQLVACGWDEDPRLEQPLHRFAKRSPMGCGRPRCGVCRIDRKGLRRIRAREAWRATGRGSPRGRRPARYA